MPGNPSNIGHTGKSVVGVGVKDVFEGEGGTEEVTTSAVDNTFRHTSGTRGLCGLSTETAMKNKKTTHVEDEERVLGSHSLARAVSEHFSTFFVPPFVTSLSHGNLAASSSKNKNVLNKRALLESSIDD